MGSYDNYFVLLLETNIASHITRVKQVKITKIKSKIHIMKQFMLHI